MNFFLLKIKFFYSVLIHSRNNKSHARYRLIIINTVTSIFAKGTGMISTIITIPLTLKYLGIERFGLWMTFSSIWAFLNFADLGLGNSLVNDVAKNYGMGKITDSKNAVSNTFFLLTINVLVLALFFLAIYSHVNWAKFYNLKDSTAIKESGLCTLIMVILFLIKLPLTSAEKIQEGMQLSFSNYIEQMIVGLLNLIGIVLAVKLDLGFISLVLIFTTIPLIISFVYFYYVLFKKWKNMKPSLKLIDKKYMAKLWTTGFLFFILNILTLLSFQIDNLIIANIKGAEYVGQFAVVSKISSIAFLFWAFLQALWPAYGEAISNKDFLWVRKTFFRSIKITLIGGSIIFFVLTYYGQDIVKIWLNKQLIPPKVLFLGFAFLVLIQGFLGIINVLLNSNHLFRVQIIPYLIATGIAFYLKIQLISIYGVNILPFITSFSFIVFFILPMCWVIKKNYFAKEYVNV